MQSRVVGQMESWRGLGRRVSRDALGWLEAAWKTGASPAGHPSDENGRNGVNGINGTETVHVDRDDDAVMNAEPLADSAASTDHAAVAQATPRSRTSTGEQN